MYIWPSSGDQIHLFAIQLFMPGWKLRTRREWGRPPSWRSPTGRTRSPTGTPPTLFPLVTTKTKKAWKRNKVKTDFSLKRYWWQNIQPSWIRSSQHNPRHLGSKGRKAKCQMKISREKPCSDKKNSPPEHVEWELCVCLWREDLQSHPEQGKYSHQSSILFKISILQSTNLEQGKNSHQHPVIDSFHNFFHNLLMIISSNLNTPG